MRRSVDDLEITDIFYKLNPRHLVTVEKPGEFSRAFHFYYADVRKRSIILVLAIFLYRMDGIIIVTANKNG